ncbi:MAG: transporter substrate-binding domain-containing protein [Candidatus Cloacimonadales bacterium]
MNKTFLLIILFLLLFPAILLGNDPYFSPQELVWIERHPLIRVAPDPDFPPIEYFEEGEYRGIAADFMKIISQKTGIKFEYVKAENWDEVLQMAQAREVDMLSAAAQTPERSKYMDFTEPYLIYPGVIITRKNNPELDKLEKLQDQRVGIVSGYVWQEMIAQDHPEINIIGVENIVEGLRQLALNQIDAFIATLPIALYYIEKEGIPNLRVTGNTPYQTKLSIHTRQDWPELSSIMSKALADIPQKQRQEINQRWIHLQSKPLISNRLLRSSIIIFLLGVLAFILIVFWNITLKRKVREKTLELQKDILQRKATEAELQSNKANYKLLVDNQLDLLVKVDKQNRFLYISPSYCQLFGKTEAELLEQEFYPLVHKDDVESTKKQMQNLYKPPYSCYIEQRAKTIHGWRWLAWNNKAILDEEGKVKEIIGSGRDITVQKNVELELEELKDNLQKEIAAQTKELQEKIDQLERFREATVEREFRINELRQELQRLRGASDENN